MERRPRAIAQLGAEIVKADMSDPVSLELMTESKFFPPASVWHLMPKLMGSARLVGG